MFDKGKPIAGRKARYIDDDIRANNEAIEAAVGFGHDFATGSTQTGEHNDGAAKIYAGDTAPTTKEDGITALNAGDVGKRLWLDTSVTPNVLKVLTAIGTPNTWTSIAQLMGMLDEDDMASDSDTLPATQQSVKAYVDGVDAENIKKDGSVAFTGNQSMGSNQLTDLPDPTSDNDAARKKYVDDEIAALEIKDITGHYDSGWFACSSGGRYTKTHNLGSTALQITVFWSDSATGASNVKVVQWDHDVGNETGAAIVDITTTQLTVQAGKAGTCYYPDSQGKDTRKTGGYYRVVATRVG